MSSVNYQAQNAQPYDGVCLDEYYRKIESGINKMQSVVGSYNPEVRIQPMQGLPNAGAFNIRISPTETFGVWDIYNARLVIKAERTFTVRRQQKAQPADPWVDTDFPAGANQKFRIGDKHSGNFIRDNRLSVSDTVISECIDFVYEMNIISAQFTDQTKSRQDKILTKTNVDPDDPKVRLRTRLC
jgi:hypothetical protein